jgi:serine/threonine protein kinase
LKQIDHIKDEKNILAEVDHPFIVNIIESFQSLSHVYMVFEYVQGGEIFRLLRRETSFPNDVALFYSTEIV